MTTRRSPAWTRGPGAERDTGVVAVPHRAGARPGAEPWERRVRMSAAPNRVAVVLARVADRIGPPGDLLADRIALVAGASDTLGDLLAESEAALGVLEDLDRRVPLTAETPAALARSHRLEMLRLVARDLAGIDDLEATVAGRTALAESLTDVVLAAVDAPGLVVVGMGKTGAAELNYVSDVDLVFVSAGELEADERAARRFVDLASAACRIDVGLRPQGRDGPLVRTVSSYRAYWDRWARPWEFQALMKARPLAGPADVASGFAEAASRAVWERPFDAESLREVRHLKARVEAEVRARGLTDLEIKRGPGGIRDIEFSAQLLQLVHGRADAALRVASTTGGLTQLAAGGYVAADEATALIDAYRFLRRLEHRLQITREQQTHTLPADRGARRRVARSLGYHGDPSDGPTERFDRDLRAHQLRVRNLHHSWYFRPLLEAFAGTGSLPEAVTSTRLEAFGFRDLTRTRQAVAELSSGLSRTSRLMRQYLPLVLDWLSEGPDPDRGLLGLRRLAEGEQRSRTLAVTFRDSAEAARRLCHLVALSPVATDVLIADPDLVERLGDDARLVRSATADLSESAWEAVRYRPDLVARQRALARWYRRHLLGVIARDAIGSIGVTEVGSDLTALAETVLGTALRLAEPQVPMAVIGFGRLGASELAYGSDLDVVFVFDGSGAADVAEAERVAAVVLRLVHGATPATRILPVDADLRPEGRDGPLARSLDSYTVYLERWAEVWERHALIRARAVAGSDDVGRGFEALAARALWSRPPSGADRREVRRMKARIERERIPAGVDPGRHVKLGPGGLADVEWTVQLLQWTAGIRRRPTRDALGRLVAADVVDPADAAVLSEALDWADNYRNRAWLAVGDGDVVPGRSEVCTVVARALAPLVTPATAGALVEHHRRVTRRARKVVERLFYAPA